MRILLKKLTEKSVIEAGKNQGLLVGEVLKKSKLDLIYAYFNYSNITFTDDILDKLNIYPSDRIEKPGKCPEKTDYYTNRNLYYAAKFTLMTRTKSKEKTEAALGNFMKKRKNKSLVKKYKKFVEQDKLCFSKGTMQRKNHGHK